MLLVDTHTHLYSEQFEEDRAEMIERALNSGIQRMYLPNVDSKSIDGMLALEKQFPENCFPMMGLHPCSVKENYKEELAIVEKWLFNRPFVAVGEIGIDLYWDETFVEEQKEAFLIQMNWAKKLDIPIVIHARNSLNLIIEIVRQEKDERLRGIFHCFSGDASQAQEIIDLGFYLGLGGVLTFKKSGIDKVAANVPMEYIVLETDSPYLAPTPKRGKRNESSYTLYVAQKLADIKSMSLEEVARITTENANNLFGFQQ
jgi:TatD DNase family protein